MATRYLLLKRLGVFAAVLAVSGIVLWTVNDMLGLGLGWRLHLLRMKLFGHPFSAALQPDDRLGWRLKPNSVTTERNPVFTATYTVGPDGDRIVPGRPETGQVVAMLGGSFTMGSGVNDDEVFSAILQRHYWKSQRVRNLACGAYGTSHVLLRLEEEFKAGRKIHLAIYNWIYHHLTRNYRRRYWLEMVANLGGKNPLFDLEDGKLVFKGLVGPEEAVDEDDPTLEQREWEITRALLKAIQKLCREHDTRFVVVLLPWGLVEQSIAIDKPMASLCRSLGIGCLDLTRKRALLTRGSYYSHDLHPTAPWHKAAARLISEGIDVKTRRVWSVGGP